MCSHHEPQGATRNIADGATLRVAWPTTVHGTTTSCAISNQQKQSSCKFSSFIYLYTRWDWMLHPEVIVWFCDTLVPSSLAYIVDSSKEESNSCCARVDKDCLVAVLKHLTVLRSFKSGFGNVDASLSKYGRLSRHPAASFEQTYTKMGKFL